MSNNPPIYAATLAKASSEVVWLLIRADLAAMFDAAARKYAPESLPQNYRHFEIGNVDLQPADDAPESLPGNYPHVADLFREQRALVDCCDGEPHPAHDVGEDDDDTIEWPPSIGFGFTVDLKDGTVTLDPLSLEHAEASSYISDRVDHDEET